MLAVDIYVMNRFIKVHSEIFFIDKTLWRCASAVYSGL